MQYSLLPWILEQERPTLHRIEHRWMPKELLFTRQVLIILRDMQQKYDYLAAAEAEMASLDRAHLYTKSLRRMRLWLRQALLFWKGDHLAFIKAMSGFYTDYGIILRLLKQDENRGRFTSPTQLNQGA